MLKFLKNFRKYGWNSGIFPGYDGSMVKLSNVLLQDVFIFKLIANGRPQDVGVR
jgi:hypothetical protein